MPELESLYLRAIADTRQSLAARQGRFGFFEKFDLKIRPPPWMKQSGDVRMVKLYEDQWLLYNHGRVVWGHIIQANSLLFSAGKFDSPAAVLYSLDPRMDGRADVLEDAAHSLYEIKGQEADPDLAAFSAKLADEMVADWKLAVPPRLTGEIPCFYTTTMIVRKHLPTGYLSGSMFPYLVCPEKTEAGMVLPSKFWSPWIVEKLW